jgi:hypothetical protein
MAKRERKKIRIPWTANGGIPHYAGYDILEDGANHEAKRASKILLGGFEKFMDGRAIGSSSYWQPDNFVARFEKIVAENTFTLKDPDNFKATLRVADYYRGRSAAGIELANERGGTFCVMIKDALHLLQHATIKGGVIHGIWRPKKRGSNYGIEYVGSGCPAESES